MKGLKKSLPIAMAVALLVALLPGGVVLADTGEGVLTNFDSNNLPVVDTVVLYNAANDAAVTDSTGMTATTTYTLRVTVTDYDTLDDITQIDIAIFYDSTGSTTAPTTSDLDTAGVFSYDTSTLTVTGTGGTWAAGTVTDPTLSGTSGYWSLPFTVGKIAKEALGQSAGGYDGWHLYAEVTDSESETAELYNRGTTDKGWAISWYGEIDSTVSTDVDFDTVDAGDTSFTQISLVDSGAATTFSIYSMANGDHKLTVVASAITGDDSGLTFSADDSPATDEVALVMDTHADTPVQGSGQYLATGAADITGYTSLSAATTSDTITDVSNTDSSSMWIKVGAQVSGSNSTTVTYTIVNA